jgi:hypothetical protein
METVDRSYLELQCRYILVYYRDEACHASKAVNREDKLSRRYRDRDLAKFERSRRYRER